MYYIVLYYIILHYILLYHIILYHIIYVITYYIIFYYIISYRIILHYIILYIILYHIILYYITLYYIILYYIISYYYIICITVLQYYMHDLSSRNALLRCMYTFAIWYYRNCLRSWVCPPDLSLHLELLRSTKAPFFWVDSAWDCPTIL